MSGSAPIRRLRKRHVVALVAIATELIAGIAWWRRRNADRTTSSDSGGVDLNRDE